VEQGRTRLTRKKIHRIAFFTHAALMVSEIVLGVLTTDALQRGDHDAVISLGVAHAAIGFTIPVIMIFGGIENMTGSGNKR
jgi:hypothetical protein